LSGYTDHREGSNVVEVGTSISEYNHGGIKDFDRKNTKEEVRLCPVETWRRNLFLNRTEHNMI
jgi:hypothetical protein